MIDSHTHLHACASPEAELVEQAREAGVRRMLTVGTDEDSCRAALAAARRFDCVLAAVGRHPNAAEGFGEEDLEQLRRLAADERCVAIGETGLDFYRQRAPRADQQRAFIAQIQLARELDRALVIHTREAQEDTLALLEAHARGLRVILHCFSMPEQLERCLAQPDWWISFAGNVTYPSAGALRQAAVRVPPARLLVETDAPYLAPQPIRGKPNAPAAVVHTAAALALARRVDYEELEAQVEAAAAAAFGW
jgi:TatD DNase family protein